MNVEAGSVVSHIMSFSLKMNTFIYDAAVMKLYFMNTGNYMFGDTCCTDIVCTVSSVSVHMRAYVRTHVRVCINLSFPFSTGRERAASGCVGEGG